MIIFTKPIVAIVLLCRFYCSAFFVRNSISQVSSLRSVINDGSEKYLKEELTKYLKTRDEMNADEAAQKDVGRVVGGTKGNAILEYVSGAPNKGRIIEEAPDTFDYSELRRYGFDYLVEPIMEAGGRLEMYKLMGMEVPESKIRMKKFGSPLRLNKDKSPLGEEGYKGLKMSTLLDDDLMGKQLQQATEKSIQSSTDLKKIKVKSGASLSQSSYWTAERIDEEGKRQGRVVDYYRDTKKGVLQKDPDEILAIDGDIRLYSIITSLFIAAAFAKSTTAYVLVNLLGNGNGADIQHLLQIPAAAILVVNFGSAIFNSVVTAPEKDRSAFVWAVKGIAGGPVSVLQLRNLESLKNNT